MWRPWKLGQGHENLINSFNYPNDKIHKVWPEYIIWFKQRVQTSFLGSKFDIRSAGVTLKMRSWSPKSNHFFLMSLRYFCASSVKIHQLIQEIECRKSSFYSLLFITMIHCTTHKVWPEYIISFKRQGADKLFWSKFDIQGPGVTLKMRSRSPKSNHFFLMSQWYFCASLVKIHQLFQEIEFRQGSFLQSL